MKKFIIPIIYNTIAIGMIAIIITLVWQGLELLYIGQIIPSHIDTFFALLLAFSIRFNILLVNLITK